MWGKIPVKQIRSIIALFALLILPLVLLYVYVRIVVMQPGFFMDVLYSEEYNLSDKSGLSQSDTERVLEKLFGYVIGNEDSPIVVVQIDGDRVNFYNERELLHLKDVNELFKKLRVIMFCLIVFEILSFTFFIRQISYRTMFKILCISEMIHVGLIVTLLLIANRSMVWFVTLFHRVLFDNNRWILNDATDRLVLLFPKILYKEVLLYFVCIWLMAMAIISIFIILKMRRSRNGIV